MAFTDHNSTDAELRDLGAALRQCEELARGSNWRLEIEFLDDGHSAWVEFREAYAPDRFVRHAQGDTLARALAELLAAALEAGR